MLRVFVCVVFVLCRLVTCHLRIWLDVRERELQLKLRMHVQPVWVCVHICDIGSECRISNLKRSPFQRGGRAGSVAGLKSA